MVSLCFGALAQDTASKGEDITRTAWYKEREASKDQRMAWWRAARFGMFIHWGVYSVPAGTYNGKRIPGIGEWIMNRAKIPVAEYKAYAKEFNPVKYDPEAWVRLAKDAGMKYIVITSKHHDGFALFDSKVTDWDVVDATPYGKDLLKPLVEAAHKAGLKIGFYYSQAQDWNHPGGAKAGYKEGEGWDEAHLGDFDAYLRNIAAPQVKEILTNYPIDILWWDTPTWMTRERAARLLPLIKTHPNLIINNRLGGGFAGDTDTPEQHIPATGIPGRDWEVCMTMNDTWGYKSYDDHWKSTQDLIRKLCDIASKGGNFLLNVGPTSLGEIPEPSVERLKAIGAWMDTNHDAIYGTGPSPFRKLNWGRCTVKATENGTSLYLMVFDWPENGRLLLPGLKTQVAGARMLDGGRALDVTRSGGDVIVHVPKNTPDPNVTVIRVALAGPVDVADTLPRLSASAPLVLNAADADIHNRGYGTPIRLTGNGRRQHLERWIDRRAHVSWAFKVEKTGAYDVTIRMASDKASRCVVRLAGEKKTVDLPVTGTLAKYEVVPLGRFTVKRTGEQELDITPDAKKWKPINVHSVTLRKAD